MSEMKGGLDAVYKILTIYRINFRGQTSVIMAYQQLPFLKMFNPLTQLYTMIYVLIVLISYAKCHLKG